MLFTKNTFIGIDPTAGKRPFAYAALDGNRQLLAVGEGQMEEVLAFVGGQARAFVAVNAPRAPNAGLMADETRRAALSPPPRPGRWTGYRVAEYELHRRGISIPRTPAQPEKCPRWMQMGFKVYQRLASLGFRRFPAGDAPLQSLEVYPHAAYTVLLEHLPFPKNTLEGRLQRQLVLYVHDVEVPNPMRVFEEITRHRLLQGILPLDDLYSASELDALVAAFTAFKAATQPESVCLAGDAAEGQIVLPVKELRTRY